MNFHIGNSNRRRHRLSPASLKPAGAGLLLLKVDGLEFSTCVSIDAYL